MNLKAFFFFMIICGLTMMFGDGPRKTPAVDIVGLTFFMLGMSGIAATFIPKTK